jgi:radical SAM superfamily enzyme YgiQ (UPF0313 family)
MKIGLVAAKGNDLFNNRELDDFVNQSPWLKDEIKMSFTFPELSLLIIAALTDSSEAEFFYMDEKFDEVDYAQKFDLIVLTALSSKAAHAYRMAAEFRKRGVYTVMGGPHASVMPDEARSFVDTVIIGEAENSWKEFLNDFKAGNPKPFYDGKKKMTDLKLSPIPRYDLLKNEAYRNIPIQTTRGCPHDCEFCSNSVLFGKTYRSKSIEQVLEEIKAIKKNPVLRHKFLFFVDDNMFANKKYSKSLLRAIIGEKMRLRWITQTDISIAEDEELLDLMFQAGCKVVLIGFESLSKNNLEKIDIWKRKQVENYSAYARKIQSHGISIRGSFIVGLDNDTGTVFQETVSFITENQIHPQIVILTPIPGTRLYARLKRENRLLPEPFWDQLSPYRVCFEPKLLSKKELADGFAWMIKKLFSEEVVKERKRHYMTALVKQL